MYILVEIIHTEFQYISLIEMQKYNWIRKELRKGKQEKKGTNTNRDKRVPQPRGAGSTFCPDWCYQPGQKVAFCPGCQTRDKMTPLLSRPGVPGWEIGTTRVSQPGQISHSVVVRAKYNNIFIISFGFFFWFKIVININQVPARSNPSF